ncbi:hypothetical protein LHJ74_10630 [Streptomyces sp. N2-109]|uniref:Secreted protein n=1 Tax=Streptomyces gossypii TaxID=2883101 RepID=A0ABT2JR49_9ACTN|nr:hypothetical protein [Streptomyces gossypii]MCT2590361.1 hypothetical protein [Streptomyces gossypii]
MALMVVLLSAAAGLIGWSLAVLRRRERNQHGAAHRSGAVALRDARRDARVISRGTAGSAISAFSRKDGRTPR